MVYTLFIEDCSQVDYSSSAWSTSIKYGDTHAFNSFPAKLLNFAYLVCLTVYELNAYLANLSSSSVTCLGIDRCRNS